MIRVNLAADGKRATGVTYIDAQGNEVEQPAELVVLCAYQFHNVRLLLLSNIGQKYDPATGRGVVGRNYAYQLTGGVSLFFNSNQPMNPFAGAGAGGTVIDDFDGDNFDHGPAGFVGGATVSCTVTGGRPIQQMSLPPGTPAWGAGWKKAIKDNYRYAISVGSQGSVMAHRDNCLDLDPTYKDVYGQPLLRMSFDWKPNDFVLAQFIKGKVEDIARAMGPREMGSSFKKAGDHYDLRSYQTTHNTGGAPMGTDPSTSAVNRFLQTWAVPNVFVMGASAFPQNFGYNPTGMVVRWRTGRPRPFASGISRARGRWRDARVPPPSYGAAGAHARLPRPVGGGLRPVVRGCCGATRASGGARRIPGARRRLHQLPYAAQRPAVRGRPVAADAVRRHRLDQHHARQGAGHRPVHRAGLRAGAARGQGQRRPPSVPGHAVYQLLAPERRRHPRVVQLLHERRGAGQTEQRCHQPALALQHALAHDGLEPALPARQTVRAQSGAECRRNRGAYLVQAWAIAAPATRPRGITGAEKASTEKGGEVYLSGALVDGWYAQPLRNTVKPGLATWPLQDIVEFLKTGRTGHTAAFGPMVAVVANSTQYMGKEDLVGIAVYLRSLGDPGNADTKPETPPNDATTTALRQGKTGQRGAMVYLNNCNACHRSDGQGAKRTFPTLAHNSAVAARDTTSLIRMVLQGSAMPHTQEAPSELAMPGFGWRLTDQNIADVLTLVRSSWGNQAAAVNAADVAKVRADSAKAGNTKAAKASGGN